jgi:glycosyltransferase involved in cell wall biosynthesis
VFCGGTSDRDFDVVIEAFRQRRVPVTLVCREDQTFRPPGPVEPHFTVRRGVSEQEYHALAAAAGVVVVALKSATSGCGQLLFSFCMRHGVPVIATDCFGTRDEVIHGHTGWLVPAGDAQALGQAYDRLAADPALRRRLVQQARAQALSRQAGLAGFVSAMNGLGEALRGEPAPQPMPVPTPDAPGFPQRPQGTAVRAADQPIGEAA